MKKEKSNEKCQAIYWNLIELLDKSEESSAAFIRELWHTKRCDEMSDLSDLRNDYEKHLGEKVLEDILNYEEESNSKNSKRANQCVLHYFYWTRKKLVNSLTLRKKISYFTFYKAESVLATFGIIGTVYGLSRFAKKSYKTIYPHILIQ